MGSTLRDRVIMSVSGTPGTGAITLGSATAGYQSASAAGVQDQEVNTWVFFDGSAWEISSCVYTSSGTSLARTLIASSTGSLLNLSSSTVCFIDVAAQDFGYAVVGQFGNEVDGNVTISGSVTLSRDMYYNNLTLAAGAALNTNGWRVYYQGICDLSNAPAGAIFCNGGNGGNAASTSSPGTAGAGPVSGTSTIIGSPDSGVLGNAGQTGVGLTGSNAIGPATSNGGVTGAAGAGGAGTPNAGGSIGTTAAALPYAYNPGPWPLLALIDSFNWTNSPRAGQPGLVAGSGGGDNTNAGGATGGSPGPGGAIFLWGNIIKRGAGTTAGCIQCKGGNAGAGFTPTTGNTGGAGGCSGAGGGFVVIGARYWLGTPVANAVDVSGGNGADGTNGHGTGVGGNGGGSGAGGTYDKWDLGSGTMTHLASAAVVAGSAHSGITGGVKGTATSSRGTL